MLATINKAIAKTKNTHIIMNGTMNMLGTLPLDKMITNTKAIVSKPAANESMTTEPLMPLSLLATFGIVTNLKIRANKPNKNIPSMKKNGPAEFGKYEPGSAKAEMNEAPFGIVAEVMIKSAKTRAR